MRQDDGCPYDLEGNRPDRGQHPLPHQGWNRGHGHPGQRRAEEGPDRDSDGLPGPLLLPESTHADNGHHSRTVEGSRLQSEGSGGTSQGTARVGRTQGGIRPAVPSLVQRWTAPEDRDRESARTQSVCGGGRRTRLCARRFSAGSGAQSSARSAGANGFDLLVHQSRFERRQIPL